MNLIRGQVLRSSTEPMEPSHIPVHATPTMSSATATSSSLLAFSQLTKKKEKPPKPLHTKANRPLLLRQLKDGTRKTKVKKKLHKLCFFSFLLYFFPNK